MEISRRPIALICESDEGDLHSCRCFLAERKFDVRIAYGGVDCLSQVRKYELDVLILDSCMLWGGAAGVLDCLREDRLLPGIPIVMITGFESAPRLSRRSGILQSCCLQKPVHPGAMLRAIVVAARRVLADRVAICH